MNPQEITYDFLIDDLNNRIARLEKQLSESKAALETIKNNPSIVPIIARLVRPELY